jgi:hypothetical protein
VNNATQGRLDVPAIEAYFIQWVQQQLKPLLKRLVEQGKTVVWRDTAPGGDEMSSHSKYTYYANFEPQNRIMHAVMREVGGYYLPIFAPSLAQWTQHPGYSKLHGKKADPDLLHWCAFQQDSVPNMWNQMLLALLVALERPAPSNATDTVTARHVAAGSSPIRIHDN